jgi:hypothetical protein
MDINKLNYIITHYKKVLIIAPRRAGKTEFLINDMCLQSENNEIFYYTLTRIMLDETVERTVKKGAIKPYNIYFMSDNRINNEKYRGTNQYLKPNESSIVYIDEILFMRQSFIDHILKQNSKIICISSIPDNDYIFNQFILNGFNIIHAPILYDYIRTQSFQSFNEEVV